MCKTVKVLKTKNTEENMYNLSVNSIHKHNT